MTVAGLLLAAGAGRRAGGPKALRRTHNDFSWVEDAAARLIDAGCSTVIVVLGAAADQAALALRGSPRDDVASVRIALATDWAQGMSASLRTGLATLQANEFQHVAAALVMLVDTPDITAEVIRHVIERAPQNQGDAVLARAAYTGTPGHPVLIGRAHWQAIIDTATGDHGARDYLNTHQPALIDCADLATGIDQDH